MDDRLFDERIEYHREFLTNQEKYKDYFNLFESYISNYNELYGGTLDQMAKLIQEKKSTYHLVIYVGNFVIHIVVNPYQRGGFGLLTKFIRYALYKIFPDKEYFALDFILSASKTKEFKKNETTALPKTVANTLASITENGVNLDDDPLSDAMKLVYVRCAFNAKEFPRSDKYQQLIKEISGENGLPGEGNVQEYTPWKIYTTYAQSLYKLNSQGEYATNEKELQYELVDGAYQPKRQISSSSGSQGFLPSLLLSLGTQPFGTSSQDNITFFSPVELPNIPQNILTSLDAPSTQPRFDEETLGRLTQQIGTEELSTGRRVKRSPLLSTEELSTGRGLKRSPPLFTEETVQPPQKTQSVQEFLDNLSKSNQ